MTKPKMYVAELRCPKCMGALQGAETDKVFVCGPCASALTPVSGTWQFTAVYAAAQNTESSGSFFRLPFWRFDVAVQVSHPELGDVTTQTPAGGLHHVWIPAFYEVRPSYFGNPGLMLTTWKGSVETALWEEDSKLTGMARTASDAEIYVKSFVTTILDKARDVTGFEILVNIGEHSLWAMPFEVEAQEMIDLVTGQRYKTALVECFAEISDLNSI